MTVEYPTLTVSAVARELKCHRAIVDKLFATGKLRSWMIGSSKKTTYEELNKYITKCEVTPCQFIQLKTVDTKPYTKTSPEVSNELDALLTQKKKPNNGSVRAQTPRTGGLLVGSLNESSVKH